MSQNRFEKNSVLVLCIALICALMIIIFLTEMALSIIDPVNNTFPESRHIRLKEHPPNSIVNYDVSFDIPTFGDNVPSGTFRIEADNEGFISPSFVHEDADLTILFLGGSTTECLYVEESLRFPYLVGRLLETDGKRVNSINGGRSGVG